MSMNLADIYGSMSSRATTLQPTSVGGPDQGAVAPSGSAPPSVPNAGGNSAAFSWLGLVLLLVILRVIYEMGGRAA